MIIKKIWLHKYYLKFKLCKKLGYRKSKIKLKYVLSNVKI